MLNINHEILSLLVDKLLSSKLKVSSAESCTGGLLSASLTKIPNSSNIFDMGFVTYSNYAKNKLLGVPVDILDKYGAVSDKVVEYMALGALKVSEANYAISISGIAGPSGGSKDKPVGTVWFGFADNKNNVIAKKQIFDGNRDEIRIKAVNFALSMLLDNINN